MSAMHKPTQQCTHPHPSNGIHNLHMPKERFYDMAHNIGKLICIDNKMSSTHIMKEITSALPTQTF